MHFLVQLLDLDRGNDERKRERKPCWRGSPQNELSGGIVEAGHGREERHPFPDMFYGRHIIASC